MGLLSGRVQSGPAAHSATAWCDRRVALTAGASCRLELVTAARRSSPAGTRHDPQAVSPDRPVPVVSSQPDFAFNQCECTQMSGAADDRSTAEVGLVGPARPRHGGPGDGPDVSPDAGPTASEKVPNQSAFVLVLGPDEVGAEHSRNWRATP
jgi:hypothetical protein